MSCSACSARVEKAVSALENVTSCSVNLLTNSMIVEGSASDTEITAAVNNAGYTATKSTDMPVETNQNEDLSGTRELKSMKTRLISSILFLIILMYFSMGKMLFRYEYFGIFKDNPIAVGIMQMLLSGIIMIINQKFFINAYKSIIHKAPNMDVLVSMGSLASFIYSLFVLINMTNYAIIGDHENIHKLSHEFYFESAAMILTLISLGKLLETYSKGRTTTAIKELMDLTPKTATVIRDEKELVVLSSELRFNDIFVVKPGESIPADGEVVDGESAVDEAALTGESLPVDKTAGDKVSAGTINRSGVLKCRAIGVGQDTTISKIIKMVSDSASTKAPIAKIADKVSGVFVPLIICFAIITTVIWLLMGRTLGFALARGICVLVISCPCALGLATPVAIMVGNGVGAKNGILFKTSEALEQVGKIKIAALDKTGTITYGEPCVTDIIPVNGNDNQELLKIAYALEKNSEHPLAKAIVSKCIEDNIPLINIEKFTILPGSGVKGLLNGEILLGGNPRLICNNASISKEITSLYEKLSESGKTPLLFSKNGNVIGVIAVSDAVKDDSREAIENLKSLGIKPVMITGDNKKTAHSIAEQIGVDEVISDVLPEGKKEAICELQKEGHVVMVGDGINDALALSVADIGIAIGTGTDIAIESADIVISKNSLMGVVNAIRLSRATIKNIKENLFWAFCYNVIGIPLAAGMLINITGWELNPMFGAAAMSLSSFCVITNALRLNFFKAINKEKESENMEVTIKIEGMMCPHCEARVKNAIETINGVSKAIVSHEKGEAIVTIGNEVSQDTIKTTIEAQGYKVIE